MCYINRVLATSKRGHSTRLALVGGFQNETGFSLTRKAGLNPKTGKTMNTNDVLNYWLKQQTQDQKKVSLPKRFYDERKRPSPKRRHHVYKNIGRIRRQSEQIEAENLGYTD